jgi:hypothetical protein
MASRDLLRELLSNGTLLLKRQLRLAEMEARRDAKTGKRSLEMLGAAGLVGYAGAIVILVAAALGLGEALGGRHWAGALIVAAILLAIAGVLAPVGWWRRVKKPLRRSREELNKELTWANSQLTT